MKKIVLFALCTSITISFCKPAGEIENPAEELKNFEYFEMLPGEILYYILDTMDRDSLRNMTNVNKQLREMAVTILYVKHYDYMKCLLQDAIKNDKNNKFKSLIVNEVNHFTIDDNNAILLWAAMENNPGAVALLIDAAIKDGLDLEKYINASSDTGFTPLHWAAFNGSEIIVQLLLDNNADSTLPDNKGNTPAYYAKLKKFDKIVELLTKRN